MMLYILKGDLYRLRKGKMFYSVVVFAAIIAFLLIMLNRQDIRLGISIFGNLTTFISVEDVIRLGVEYQKGLGILIAVFISVFIGQEYQWNTWQHKWLISKSRVGMYLSKVLLSGVFAAMIFFIFEIIALLCSGQISSLFTSNYVATVICGSFIYAALGAVLCLISMLIKNSTEAVIVTLSYVLFSETLITVIQNISSTSSITLKVAAWFFRHSIFGMSSILSTAPMVTEFTVSIILSSLGIIIVSTVFGTLLFRKYEL